MGGVIRAATGDSGLWTTAHSWGDHGAQGYLKTGSTVAKLTFTEKVQLQYTTTDYQHDIYPSGEAYFTFKAHINLAAREDSTLRMGAVAVGAMYFQGFDNSDAQAFILRTYTLSGIQLTLDKGGISAAGVVACSSPTADGHAATRGYVLGLNYINRTTSVEWQTSSTATPTWDLSDSANIKLTPSTASTTLTASNFNDGESGIILLMPTDSGTLTFPANGITSYPASMAYTDNHMYIIAVTREGTKRFFSVNDFGAIPV